jgi:hypothetical protein
MSKKFDRNQLRRLIQQEILSLGEDILVIPEPQERRRQGTPPLAPQAVPCRECGSSMYEDEGSCMECGTMYEKKSETLSEGDCGCSGSSPASLGDFQDLSIANITHDDASNKSGAYMSKSQLYKVSRYSAKLYDMIPENHDLEDWMRTKISQIADDIGEVYHALDHDRHEGDV